MMESISFCILDTPESKALTRCLENIFIQKVPDFDVIVSGSEISDNRVKHIYSELMDKKNINRMRNRLCENASKDYIVLMDSRVELVPDWYSKVRQIDFYEIAGCRLITPDNKRVLDWAYQVVMPNGQVFYHLLQYDEWSTKAFVSDYLMIMKKNVWEKLKFNEDLLSGLDGNVDFCKRASDIGFRLGVCNDAIAIYHCDKKSIIKYIKGFFERGFLKRFKRKVVGYFPFDDGKNTLYTDKIAGKEIHPVDWLTHSKKNDSERVKIVMDGENNFWEDIAPFPVWIQTFPGSEQVQIAQCYTMQTGNHGDDSTNRMPNDWILLGSNDGEEWTKLDHRTNETCWNQNEKRLYRITKPKKYNYYRLQVNASNDPNIVRLYKLRLYSSEDS